MHVGVANRYDELLTQSERTMPEEDLRNTRLQKVAQLRSQGVDPYPYRFAPTDRAAELQERYSDLPNGAEVAVEVAVAGRVIARRVLGKLAFFTIQDESGRIQLLLEKGRLGETMGPEAFKQLDRLVDGGDIVGVHGTIRRTDRGELSISVREWVLLCKALLPLPSEYYGIKDTEKLYRQRYLGLILDGKVRETFKKRALTVRAIRHFLDERDFLEIETPVLQVEAGGASARPFVTHHNALDMTLFLRIATELHLKRMVVGGFERVYELGRIFRNEGISPRHNPEFTSIEIYQAYADYHGIMDLVEALLKTVATEVLGTTTARWEGHEIDLSEPFRRLTMAAAVETATGIDFLALTDGEAVAKAEGLGIEVKAGSSRGEVLYRAFEERVEKTLVEPTFILDYPIEISPLAKNHRTLAGFVERFELYICGREMADGFSELNDPIEQRRRLEIQAAARAAGDQEAQPLDEDFLAALEHGLPPTGGVGIGIDRLVMFLTDNASIRDVIAFPTLKPEAGE